jgi:hypothetical protein
MSQKSDVNPNETLIASRLIALEEYTLLRYSLIAVCGLALDRPEWQRGIENVAKTGASPWTPFGSQLALHLPDPALLNRY